MNLEVRMVCDLNYWGFMLAVGIEERQCCIHFLCFNLQIEVM